MNLADPSVNANWAPPSCMLENAPHEELIGCVQVAKTSSSIQIVLARRGNLLQNQGGLLVIVRVHALLGCVVQRVDTLANLLRLRFDFWQLLLSAIRELRKLRIGQSRHLLQLAHGFPVLVLLSQSFNRLSRFTCAFQFRIDDRLRGGGASSDDRGDSSEFCVWSSEVAELCTNSSSAVATSCMDSKRSSILGPSCAGTELPDSHRCLDAGRTVSCPSHRESAP